MNTRPPFREITLDLVGKKEMEPHPSNLRYLKPEDFPNNPVPQFIEISPGTYCTNPVWISAPFQEYVSHPSC